MDSISVLIRRLHYSPYGWGRWPYIRPLRAFPIQLKLEEGFFRLYARSRRVRRKESRLKLRRVEQERGEQRNGEGRRGGEGDMLRVRVRARGEVDVSRVVKLDKRNWRERFDEQKGRAKRGGEERVLMKWHRHSSLFIRREIRRRLYSHRFEITSHVYRVLFFILYYIIIIRDSHLFAKRSWLENWISRFLLGWVNISKGCYGCWVLSRFTNIKFNFSFDSQPFKNYICIVHSYADKSTELIIKSGRKSLVFQVSNFMENKKISIKVYIVFRIFESSRASKFNNKNSRNITFNIVSKYMDRFKIKIFIIVSSLLFSLSFSFFFFWNKFPLTLSEEWFSSVSENR